MKARIKRALKLVAQQTVGRLPPSPGRLRGPLALDGGAAVRDVRLRPWHRDRENGLAEWTQGVAGALRGVFLSGVEGLPQPLAQRFAAQWAKYCGCRFGLLLAHGTDALRLGLAAALDHDGLDYGGEVIVPNLSFIASATVALDRRFGVAFADVDPDTWTLDPRRVEEAIVPGRTRAILPVHLFGQPANMAALRDVARRHGLKLIEDAAQAHGASTAEGRAGSLGDVAGFSFQSAKNLSCGEGGALTTNDEELFERAYRLHNVGRRRVDGERWGHESLGWNCRPTEYQAALLLERFRRFEARQKVRRRNFATLRRLLAADVPAVVLQAEQGGAGEHGAHMFAMRYLPERCDGIPLEAFLAACAAEGAPVYRGYSCTVSQQPAMRALKERRAEYVRELPTPAAERIAAGLIYVPQEIFLGSEADMRDIAAALAKVARHYAARG